MPQSQVKQTRSAHPVQMLKRLFLTWKSVLIMSIPAPYVLEHTEVGVGRQGSAGWHSAAGSTPEWLTLALRLLPASSQRWSFPWCTRRSTWQRTCWRGSTSALPSDACRPSPSHTWRATGTASATASWTGGEGPWAGRAGLEIQPTNPHWLHKGLCCSDGQGTGDKHWELGSGFRLGEKRLILEEVDAMGRSMIASFALGHE